MPLKPSVLADHLVVPVVVMEDVDQARPLGEALLAGGIGIAEVTLRTAAGLAAIQRMSEVPGLTVGAGSVLTPEQVDQVVDAGAEFVVSPGISPAVVERAAALGVPALPGVATASDLMTAVALGLSEVKFFPANLLGGPAGIRSLSAPFAGLTFMPSGGVNPGNMGEYLALPCVPAVSGTWMADPRLLAAGRWDEVRDRSAAALLLARRAFR